MRPSGVEGTPEADRKENILLTVLLQRGRSRVEVFPEIFCRKHLGLSP
jgi:hypothetical protein